MWLYSQEFYPTSVRSIGMGVANSLARVGGIVAPFLAQGAFESAPSLEAQGSLFLILSAAAAV